MLPAEIWEHLAERLGVWPEVWPYLDRLYDRQEARLVLAFAGSPFSAREVAETLCLEAPQAADLVQRAYGRCVLDRAAKAGERDSAGTTLAELAAEGFLVASFEKRLDHYAKFEAWDHIPAEDRRAIDRRFLDSFVSRCRQGVDRKKLGLEAQTELPNDTVLLLPEVEEMIAAATHLAVQPCDCRRLGQYCDLPTSTCLALDASARDLLDRGHGRRLDRAEALELVRWADRKGLMHTGDSEWKQRGLQSICNCCACDCYPFRAARELGSKGYWPLSRHVAEYDSERCHQCGACVKRCHFGAFYYPESEAGAPGEDGRRVEYAPVRCWGCGLCANTCPSDAITMRRL